MNGILFEVGLPEEEADGYERQTQRPERSELRWNLCALPQPNVRWKTLTPPALFPSFGFHSKRIFGISNAVDRECRRFAAGLSIWLCTRVTVLPRTSPSARMQRSRSSCKLSLKLAGHVPHERYGISPLAAVIDFTSLPLSFIALAATTAGKLAAPGRRRKRRLTQAQVRPPSAGRSYLSLRAKSPWARQLHLMLLNIADALPLILEGSGRRTKN
jgi:hypothetical protein